MWPTNYVLADIVKRPSSTKRARRRKEHFQRPTGQSTCRAFLGRAETTYFDREKCAAAIVTCGGLCPGLNDVIYHIVSALSTLYGVKNIFGIKGGWHGFYNGPNHSVLQSRLEYSTKGTILGAARGGFEPEKIFEAIKGMGVNLVFIIGGDGRTEERSISTSWPESGKNKSPRGYPKDHWQRHWDYRPIFAESAVEEARKVIKCAKTEALCAPNGVGIVKLMGRHAGFIAVHAI